MTGARATVRLVLYCAHAGCSEQTEVQAERSTTEGSPFDIVPPHGWSGVREQRADDRAPYEVPALCPIHRPDVRGFLARSIGEIAAAVRVRRDGHGRDIRARLTRCVQAMAMWKIVPPTEQQVSAMTFLVAELRAEVGLPPGLVSGVRPAARVPPE